MRPVSKSSLIFPSINLILTFKITVQCGPCRRHLETILRIDVSNGKLQGNDVLPFFAKPSLPSKQAFILEEPKAYITPYK